MVRLEKGKTEGIPEPPEYLTIHHLDEIRWFALCIVQDSQDQLFVGKEQLSEDIQRRMDDLIGLTDLFYRMGMQKIVFQHGEDEAQAVRRIGDQHFGKKGMGMSAGDTLYPGNTQGHCLHPVIF